MKNNSFILIFLLCCCFAMQDPLFAIERLTPDKALLTICRQMNPYVQKLEKPAFSNQQFDLFLRSAGLQLDATAKRINMTSEKLQAECNILAQKKINYQAKLTEINQRAETHYRPVGKGRVVRFETTRNQHVKGFFYEATDAYVLVNDTRHKWKTIKREYWHLFSSSYAEQDKQAFINEQQAELNKKLSAEAAGIYQKNWQNVVQHNVYSCGSFYDPEGKKWVNIIPLLKKEFKIRIDAENEKRRIAENIRRQQDEERKNAEEKKRRQEEIRLAEEEKKRQEAERLKQLQLEKEAEAKRKAEEALAENNKLFSEENAKLQSRKQQLNQELKDLLRDETALREKHEKNRGKTTDHRSLVLRDDLLLANRKLAIKQAQIKLLQDMKELWDSRAAATEKYKQLLRDEDLKKISSETDSLAAEINDLKIEMNDLRNYMTDLRAELKRLDEMPAKQEQTDADPAPVEQKKTPKQKSSVKNKFRKLLFKK